MGGTAGTGGARTTRRQRAVGFVMTTFQKITSSSPRAIRQALRRRLLVLLARRQLELEALDPCPDGRRRGLSEELGRIFGAQRIAMLKGDPLAAGRG